MSSTDLALLYHQQFSLGKNENGAGEGQRRFANQNIKLNGLVCKSGAKSLEGKNEALNTLINKGSYAQIYQKWFRS